MFQMQFDQAARMGFINDCIEKIENSKFVFCRQPGLRVHDLALLAQEMSPALKYHSLDVHFVGQWGSANASDKLRAQCLMAGIIVYERERQVLDWLDSYATFDAAITRDDVGMFPRLNVRQAVKPELYDRIVDRRHPIHVRYALSASDTVFKRVKGCERYLRNLSPM